MNRKEMETVLESVIKLMLLLRPYVNYDQYESWQTAIGIAQALVFETDEEA